MSAVHPQHAVVLLEAFRKWRDVKALRKAWLAGEIPHKVNGHRRARGSLGSHAALIAVVEKAALRELALVLGRVVDVAEHDASKQKEVSFAAGEERVLQEALTKHKTIGATAEALGVSTTTLWRKMKRHNIKGPGRGRVKR